MPSSKDKTAYIEYLVETYSDLLLRVALHQLSNKSEAEDVVQTVFLKLLRALPDFADAEHEKAWLIRVTINQSRDYVRAAWNKKTTALDETLPAAQREKHPEVLQAVRSLPEKYSTIVFLYYYEGYATREIAQILGMPQNTVESRLHRARAKLKEMLKEDWSA